MIRKIRTRISASLSQRESLLKIFLGAVAYVALGQVTHYIRNPMLPEASLALNMVVLVIAGYWGGPVVGGAAGLLGTLANFLVKIPFHGPDLYELAAILPHALMGAAAGSKELHAGTRVKVGLTILIGHILNLAAFVLMGLIPLETLITSPFWLGLLAEVMIDLILVVLSVALLEHVQGRAARPTWAYLGWLRFSLLSGLNLLLILLLLREYHQNTPYIDYLMILSVVFIALTLGFLEAWLSALLITIWVGQRLIRDGLLAGTREAILILVLNTVALIIGDVVSNLRYQRRMNRLHLEELQEAYTVLSEADRLKEQMIQNISHELRTPLSMILGYSELLVDGTWGELTEAQQEAAQVIHRHAQRLAYIVEKVTVLDRIEGGKLTRHPTSIEALAQNLLAAWRKKPLAAMYNLELQVAGQIPPVNGDARYLRLAIEALLDNAIKFSPEGSNIVTRVWTKDRKVFLAIQDPGISKKDQALLFERFYQVDGTTTRRFNGLGTGLALVKEVIYAHGGDVWVESEVGHGSTFGFWIPLDRTTAAWQENSSVFT